MKKKGRTTSLKAGPKENKSWSGTMNKKGSDAFSAASRRKIKRAAKLSKFTTQPKSY